MLERAIIYAKIVERSAQIRVVRILTLADIASRALAENRRQLMVGAILKRGEATVKVQFQFRASLDGGDVNPLVERKLRRNADALLARRAGRRYGKLHFTSV